ncbi:MAG: zf-HC2 domain-containing protein [Nitrospirae bacterium]|nr:zf-HC2 domain-containing protein [Nitrospirota bacterium]
MRCKKYRRLLALYVGNDLSPKQNRSLENHLSGCSECRRELSLLQTSQEVIKRIGKADVPELKWEEFWPPIRRQVLGNHSRFLRPHGRLLVIKRRLALSLAVPCLVLLAVAGLYLFPDFRHFSRPDVRSVVPSPLVKEKAGKSEISIWLGSKYPIIDYIGNADAGIIAFNTKDPMIKIVWIFDDAFDLTLAK